MEKLETLAERMVWARSKKGWSQQQLADEAGVSQSTIGNLEAGIRDTARKITSIARVLEVDSVWLAEGRGAANETLASAPTPEFTLQWVSDEESKMLSEFRACADPQREMVLTVLESLPKVRQLPRSERDQG